MPSRARFLFYAMLITFVIALAVRAGWVLAVQSPYDTIYSDMGGYVDRARALVLGTKVGCARFNGFYPYGAHYLYALEFRTLGLERQHVIPLLNATLAALAAPSVTFLASHMFRNRIAPCLLGLAVAVWHPLVAFVGFFSSEVPFCLFATLNAVIAVRLVRSGRGALLFGLTAACAFAIRPQFLLTLGLMGLPLAFRALRAMRTRRFWKRTPLLVLPLVAVLIFSTLRLHRIGGYWGLISDNGPISRLFADTTYGKVESHWREPDGGECGFWFGPPSKPFVSERAEVAFQGYIGDGTKIDPIRRKFLQDKTLAWRVRRFFSNVSLLAYRNPLWPEMSHVKSHKLRQQSQVICAEIMGFAVFPLALFGLLMKRRNLAMHVVRANLLTSFAVAGFYWGEARYRIPYDPFVFLSAAAGVAGLWGLSKWGAQKLFSLRKIRKPSAESV